jgi:hypothetical protein
MITSRPSARIAEAVYTQDTERDPSEEGDSEQPS